MKERPFGEPMNISDAILHVESFQRASTLLKTEFLGLCAELEVGVPGLTCRIRDYGDLDFDKFQQIENRGKASRTWHFGLRVQIQETELRYIFWFGSHHQRPSDPFPGYGRPKIAILVSQEEENHYSLLDDLSEDRIGLRELIPVRNLFKRRRWNPIEEKDEWDEEITAGTVARDFLQEVLGKLGLA